MSASSAVIDVWHVDLDAACETPEDILSEDELARAARFATARHRRRFMTGRAALRRILASRLALAPAALRFNYGDWGKPALAPRIGGPALTFNISHCADLMLCAVGCDRAIGIDVERVRQDTDVMGLAQRYFSAQERAMLAQLDAVAQRQGFIACWTRKEAYIKAIGMGLSAPLDGFSVSAPPNEPPRLLSVADAPEEASRWSMAAFDPAPGFTAALVAEGGDWSLVHHRW